MNRIVFAIALFLVPASAYAQTVGTYQEDNGATKNNIGVVNKGGSANPDTVVQPTASSLNAQVVGNVANNTTDSGNGVKVSGIYQTAGALAAITVGNRADLQTDIRANLRVINTGIGVAPGVTGTQYALTMNSSSATITAPTVMPLAVGNYIWDGTNTIPARTIAGAVADGTGLGVTAVETVGALFANITTATTTTVKSGKGIFHRIVFNTSVASATVTMYDSTTASGTKIGTITLPVTVGNPTPVVYEVQFTTGLTIVTSGATDVTVTYR